MELKKIPIYTCWFTDLCSWERRSLEIFFSESGVKKYWVDPPAKYLKEDVIYAVLGLFVVVLKQIFLRKRGLSHCTIAVLKIQYNYLRLTTVFFSKIIHCSDDIYVVCNFKLKNWRPNKIQVTLKVKSAQIIKISLSTLTHFYTSRLKISMDSL